MVGKTSPAGRQRQDVGRDGEGLPFREGKGISFSAITEKAADKVEAGLKQLAGLTSHKPGGAVGPKLVPEGGEEVEELEGMQAGLGGRQRVVRDGADEVEDEHHHEAVGLHVHAPVPALVHQPSGPAVAGMRGWQ